MALWKIETESHREHKAVIWALSLNHMRDGLRDSEDFGMKARIVRADSEVFSGKLEGYNCHLFRYRTLNESLRVG